MATDTVTIGQFVTDNGITLRAVPTDNNRNMADSADMDHWKVTLVRPNGEKTVLKYRTRDLGYGSENGSATGQWGETDTWGKRTFYRSGALPIYLFPDEIVSEKSSTSEVRMTLTFSKGIGHHGAEPTVTEVLGCLASDASGVENAGGDFEEWCSEYGYDTDSRTAERIFKACQHQANRLKSFLGDEAFEQLLWHTERA
jgi:hypothetical protein